MNRKRIGIILVIMAVIVGGIVGYYHERPETNGSINASNDQKKKLEQQQDEKCKELVQQKGRYDEKTIVLSDTNESRAKALADKMGASVRMTADKHFAVLTLPKDVKVADIYSDKEYRQDLSEMSLNYHVKASAVDASQHELYQTRADYEVSDPDYDKQSETGYLNLRDTWKHNKGAGVTVAIIDTGIDTDHEEFQGRISKLSYNASDDKIVKDYDMSVIEDEQGHGTSVAGTLGASMNNGSGITGVAPETELLVIKCDADAQGNFLRASDLVFGLAYAIEADADVVNMSFVTDENIFSYYTKLAADSDVICVAAAGNDSTALLNYPAADENVIGVGALDSDWELAAYSNYGDNSDIVAPGSVYTTKMGGTYGYTQGTSLASPIVAAAAALYRADHPGAEFKEIRDYLIASSVDLGTSGEDVLYGYGALDIYAFLYEEKGTITYEMQTDEIKNQTQPFVKGHTVQLMLEPEREDVVFDGWYYDRDCTDEVEYYTDVFSQDVTLYAKWVNEDDANAYTYATLSDGTIKILSYTGKRKYLTVPDTIEGKTVSCIGESAFENNARLRKVSLPEHLTEIMPYAFNGCSRLLSIDVPESVQTIGTFAFYGCARMSSVGIVPGSDLRTIGEQAFANTMISSFTIPQKLSELGDGAFLGCRGMRKITVAEGNTTFQEKEHAVYDSTGTKLIYYPTGLAGSYPVAEGTKEIGKYAFAYARASQITLPDGLETIGDQSFTGVSANEITIPASVRKMGEYAFSYSSLMAVDLPEDSQLTKISEGAFMGCLIATVSIPKGIAEIESGAFSSTGLVSVNFAEDSQLELIGNGAFQWSNLRKITLPDTVQAIDLAAFASCQELSQVTFGADSKCTVLGGYAFSGTRMLKQIKVPDSVRSFGELCFYQSGLEEIEIGAGLTEIGEGALSYCQNLQDITVDNDNAVFGSYDGVLFNAEKTKLMFYPAAKTGAYTLPKTTETIAGYAFSGASKLTEVTLNDGLIEIGRYAFSDCESLQTPVFPEGLERISENAFENCSSMTEKCLIPKSVSALGRFAFAYDYNLTAIEIEPESKLNRLGYGVFGYCGIEDFTVPENVSTMGQEVFTGCKNLVTVTFEGESQLERIAAWTFQGADALRRITFEEGSSLTLLEARALEGLTSLNHLDLKYCTKLQEIDNYALNHCSSLTDISLPQSLTVIGRYAFQGCTSLKKLTVPAKLSQIGRYAFVDTDKIEIYFKASVLPEGLEEKWNEDVAAYYLGVSDVVSSGEWEYALTEDGDASIVAYHGSATDIALDKIDGHDIISIGGKVFQNNIFLRSITLPETLTGIYQNAFAGTTELQEITIPAAVRVVDDHAFTRSGLAKVEFAAGSKLVTLGRYAFTETKNLTKLTLPKGVDRIRDYTFYKSGIKELTFADGAEPTQIGRYVFAGSALTDFTVPDSVTNIDYNAFSDATSLTKVDLGNGEKLTLQGNAFYNSGLTEVTIPAGVDHIGELCFAGCENLKAIRVAEDNQRYSSDEDILYNKAQTTLLTCPANKEGSYTVKSTVTSFGFAAFEKSKLSQITIPQDSRLSTIGYRAFMRCEKLEQISIPAGLQSIDRYAFAYCSSLKTVEVPEGSQLGGIYKSAFYNCSQLESIRIPDGVQEIGAYAFYGCNSLNNMDITDNSKMMSIDDHAFEYSAVTNFTMPKDLVEIGTAAFNGAKLDTLIVNDSIQEIGRNAFADCGLAKMTKLEFPVSVTYLGNGALKGANTIEELTLPFFGEYLGAEAGNGYINTVKLDDLFAQEQWTTIGNLKKLTILQGQFVPEEYCWSVEGISEVNLPDTVTEVGACAFCSTSLTQISLPENLLVIRERAFEATSPERVVFPEKVNKINASAFRNCSRLMKIDLPKSLNFIGEEAFYNTSLEEVTLPDKLNYIQKRAFALSSLKNIEIPAGVTSIGEGAFSENKNLERIDVDEQNEAYCSVDGVLYNIEKTELLCVPGKLTGSVTIPNGIQRVGDYSFAGTGVTEVVLPDSLKVIGEGAFLKSSLKEIDLPDGVTEIGKYAFQECVQLEQIELSENLHEIPYWLFMGDTKLHKAELPDNIEKIDSGAFEQTGIKYVSLGSKLKTLGDSVFNGCSQLQYIRVDETNQYFKTQDGILYNKEGTKLLLTPMMISGEVVIPEGVKRLEKSAFSDREKLEKIVLPDSLEYIGKDCFLNCSKLKAIYMGENVSFIGQGAFGGTGYYYNEKNWENGVLYIGSYAVCSNLGYVTEYLKIKEGTRLIAAGCLSYNETLNRVEIPDSVLHINEFAFYYCKNLKSVKMSRRLTSIGEYAFGYCGKIYSIVLPETLTTHGFSEFAYCAGLKYILFEADPSNLERSSMFFDATGIECIRIAKVDEAALNILYNGSQNVNVITDATEISEATSYNGSVVYSHVKRNDEQRLDNLYYDGEWNQATFWIDGMVLQMEPVLSAQVLLAPAQSLIDQYLPDGAKFIGWDIDGDGKADKLPATLTADLNAYAVYDTPIQSVSLPESAEVEEGYTKKLTVTYAPEEYSHDDTLLWSSSDETVATVTEDGTVKGIAQGEAVITAALKEDPSIKAECTVTVTQVKYGIKLSEYQKELNVGETYQIPAEIVVPKDDTDTTEWISSDESVATVSENGEVTAVAPGETDIRIRHGSIDEAHYTVRVYAPLQSISFKETITQMNVGDEKKLQITYDPVNTSDDKSVTWISTDKSVLKVNADGTVTAKGPGHAKIIALVNGRACEMEVEVFAPLQWIKLNTATETLRLERKKELSVIYEPENTTDDTTVQWESSDPSIATVDENGVVTAVQTGKATITATVGDKTASYEVTVVGLKDDKTGIIVSNSDDSEMDKDMTLGVDEITREALQKKYPKGWELFWKIIQEMIKAAKGHKPVTPIFDISLYENEAAVQPGQSVDVEIPVPDGVLTEDAVIYRIEEDGTITDMHAKYQNGKFTFQTEHFSVYALGTKSEQIYTTDITLDQDALALCPGKTATLSAIAAPENITKPGINWKSSDESVAIVSEDGVISAVAAGTATISAIAADNEEVTAQCLVTVGHSYGEPIVIKYANCSETGRAVEVCGGCGESREIILPIDSDAHVWGEDYVIDREASEDEEGQKSIHCNLCDAINPESIIMIPKVTPAPTETPVPTIEPTETPTVKPSETPVPMETPTVKPGESPKPTEKPSETLVPTIEPTEIPTVKPSESPKPTETPVPIETVTPTAKPSESTVPTVTPTVKPGETPQPTEAVTPTAKPSETPAPTGTVTPTAKPSETPVPTEPVIPTVKPSETPKPTETVTPTVKPSETPAPIPTQPAAPDGTSQPLPSLDQGMVSPDPSHGDTVSAGTVLVKDGVTYRITADDTVEYQKADAKAKGTVVIPATVTLQGTTYKVTSIAAKAFYNNKKLKKIVIGKNVVQIGKKAFYGCSNLKNIVIKTKELTAKTVGKKAFYKVHKKAVVKVPKKCKKQYKIWLKKTGITGQREIR